MNKKVETNGVVSNVSGAATAVPEDSEVDNAVCTDIAARNEAAEQAEFFQRKQDLALQGEARAFGENIGSCMQNILRELHELRDEVKALRIGQENMTAAGTTVDDIYIRMIELENTAISSNDYDPDEWVHISDFADRVRDLRFTVTAEVEVD